MEAQKVDFTVELQLKYAFVFDRAVELTSKDYKAFTTQLQHQKLPP